ncbi:lanthionine synthetase C family protein [Streptomyces sp. RerS4]|uniref:lanthionine synthetase C family protein n=1 Tax=Streptomyces sp. RerS4 TaxID=2942449 RepID=UPI00201BE2CA|nr:lanthionine synthetase C family protein [Streptomyces sp. RerS4]UQX04766.1 lanthionine synthetase C family protein [Streptomyces sp. RerS4]
MAPPAWRPAIVDPQTVASVRAICVDVLSRLRDPAGVERAVRTTPRQGRPRWTPHSTAQGACGLALACGHLDRCLPGEGWDLVAHHHLSRAVDGTTSSPVGTLGLFAGLTGVAFTTSYLAHGGQRYRSLLGGIDESLYTRIPRRLPAVTGEGLAVGTFDLVSGWTGVAAYLHSRPSGPARDRALDTVLAWLVDLSRIVDGVPAWHTPRALITDESLRDRYRTAVANCGLAHGITGPLAMLALAHADGPIGAGHTEAIRRTASWLASQQVDDARGGAYPAVVPLGEDSAAPSAARDAWCYGSPGVARALWLAGTALGDPDLTRTAVAAMRTVLRRPVARRRIDSPGFCHGIAGLLQVTLRFAVDTGDQEISDGARRLVDQLLGEYQPQAPFGYRSVEPDSSREDRSGLLEGAAGIALTLLSAVSAEPPAWDRFFLLS